MRHTDSEHLRDIGLEMTNVGEDGECEDEGEENDENDEVRRAIIITLTETLR